MSFNYNLFSNIISLKKFHESQSYDSTTKKFNDIQITSNINSSVPNFHNNMMTSVESISKSIISLLSESKQLQAQSNRMSRSAKSKMKALQIQIDKVNINRNQEQIYQNKSKNKQEYQTVNVIKDQKTEVLENRNQIVTETLNILNNIIKHFKESYDDLYTWQLSNTQTGISEEVETQDMCLKNLINNKIIIKAGNKQILDDSIKNVLYEEQNDNLQASIKQNKEPNEKQIKKIIRRTLYNADKDNTNTEELKRILLMSEVSKVKANNFIKMVKQGKVNYLQYQKDVNIIQQLDID